MLESANAERPIGRTRMPPQQGKAWWRSSSPSANSSAVLAHTFVRELPQDPSQGALPSGAEIASLSPAVTRDPSSSSKIAGAGDAQRQALSSAVTAMESDEDPLLQWVAASLRNGSMTCKSKMQNDAAAESRNDATAGPDAPGVEQDVKKLTAYVLREYKNMFGTSAV